jgi:DUF1680 family protein
MTPSPAVPSGAASTFPLAAVRLGDGALRRAQLTSVEYVLSLDPDRLLAPFLREAGLTSPVPSYGSWEAIGLDGHIGGHYLSALAQLSAATGDGRLVDRLDHMLDGLERCAAASGTGWLGGVPDGPAFGEALAAGRMDADVFNLEGRWVPLYNLHKTLGGLLDVFEQTGSPRALHLAEGMADWWLAISARVADDAFETMLGAEHGGMTDAFATLAAITGRTDLLREAGRFAQRAVLDPLADGRDELDGLHANTQIPKVIGFERLGRMTGDARLLRASDRFWESVAHRRTTSIGGNSVREHFHRSRDFGPMILDEQGPETCNSYNMLELTRLRFERTGDPALLDLTERTMLNHVLSSQHPDHGGLVYFTSHRPAHYRVYSRPEESMWCCVGTGMENHARYGDMVFAHEGRHTLLVNLYLPAALDWAEAGVHTVIDTDLPRSGVATLTLTVDEPTDLEVRLRRPSWATTMTVAVDGEPVDTAPAGSVSLRRTWSGSTVVTVQFGMEIRAEQLPDGSAWASFSYGPLVLASRDGAAEVPRFVADDTRMGHVADGPKVPLEKTPIVTSVRPADAVTVVDRTALSFRLDAWRNGERVSVPLEPFAGIHDERYTLYWPTGQDPAARAVELRELDDASTDDDVVDEVAAGEQQPEVDHGFVGTDTRAGGHGGQHWRSATGWFSYELRDPGAVARVIRLRLRPLDAVDPAVAAAEAGPLGQVLRVGGVQVDLDEPVRLGADDVIEVAITDAMRTAATEGALAIAVHARPGGRTRDVLGIQLRRDARNA